MDENVTDDVVLADDGVREKLERIRALYAEALPVLAMVETLLGIADRERYVGREWLPDWPAGE